MDHSHHDHMSMDKNMDMDMGGNMSDTCTSPMMMMYFHTGTCEYVLFEKIVISNAAQMGGACVVVFLLTMLYEGLKCLREYLLSKQKVSTKYYNTTMPSGSSSEAIVMEQGHSLQNKMLSCSHLLQTVLHMFQVFLSYCLMLIFMTYNAWFAIAIIAGAGAGYFVFGWKRAMVVDINEHCH